jgi:hypothetical protein
LTVEPEAEGDIVCDESRCSGSDTTVDFSEELGCSLDSREGEWDCGSDGKGFGAYKVLFVVIVV